MNTEALLAKYPQVFHMAEADTWQSIKAHGLLSTAAVLDRFGITGIARRELETRHRPEKVHLGPVDQGIVLRDQKPMPPDRLAIALGGQVDPSAWYRRLNGMVFFWAEEHRLEKLLNARHYRALEHDVLTIDARSLLAAHQARIWLCPMNSGNTFPMPHRRDHGTFARIEDYLTKSNGGPAKPVVEIVVDYSVPDIAQHVVQVRRMRGREVLRELPV